MFGRLITPRWWILLIFINVENFGIFWQFPSIALRKHSSCFWFSVRENTPTPIFRFVGISRADWDQNPKKWDQKLEKCEGVCKVLDPYFLNGKRSRSGMQKKTKQIGSFNYHIFYSCDPKIYETLIQRNASQTTWKKLIISETYSICWTLRDNICWTFPVILSLNLWWIMVHYFVGVYIKGYLKQIYLTRWKYFYSNFFTERDEILKREYGIS